MGFIMSFISLALVSLLMIYANYVYHCFTSNVNAAKQSGIPYVRVPVTSYQPLWLLTHQIWLPLLRNLPHSWTVSWIDFVVPGWSWTHQYEPYKRIASDIFLTVSPFGIVLWVCHAEAIRQITTRRESFPKDTRMYNIVDLFGKNVVTTEGATWRMHRRFTASSFSEKNNQLVWTESLHQAQAMLGGWVGRDLPGQETTFSVAADTASLSLNVISRAGFGLRLDGGWGERQTPGNSKAASNSVSPMLDPLAFKAALTTLLNNLFLVALMPKRVLNNSPFEVSKIASQSFQEFGRYMNELLQVKKGEIIAGRTREGMDLMGALMQGAVITKYTDNASRGNARNRTIPTRQLLSDEEILGNTFIFIVAGHETTASTIHHALLFLALHPGSQRNLQKDLDQILGDQPIDKWDYERDLPKLLNSMVGAVINETLRLIPPIMQIPKLTPKTQPQSLEVDGRKFIVPAGTHVNIVLPATHRNPNYWPADPHNANDLNEFRPERWLLNSENVVNDNNNEPNTTALSPKSDTSPSSQDTPSSILFHPPKGAYLPFSDGPRACLGRRFAQVEIATVLAVLFRSHSIELAVDKYASDDEIDRMPESEEQRKGVWEKAAQDARRCMREGVRFGIAARVGQGVGVRVVRRGAERF